MKQVSLLLSTVLATLLTAPASWGQTYNPTASDPTTGNTAGGRGALPSNRGSANTALGLGALASNTGSINTALGASALLSNTTGSRNTASGESVLGSNTTGSSNTALGASALLSNTTGSRNTASGSQALLNTTTGSRNTALGWGAGSTLISGSDNIYLGHPGAASESRTMRLGSSAQTRAFIAGVAGRPISGSQVMINSAGQLGVLASSARYKQDIQPMGDQQQKLQQLRPVTFHYKEEPTGPIQYGLIAEEVAKVYPELVIRNDDGTIEGIHYEALAPLLLNQVQQQEQKIAALKVQLMELQRMVAKR